MSLLKKTLKYTSPAGYAAVKASEHKQLYQAKKAEKVEAKQNAKTEKADAKQAQRDAQAAFVTERGTEIAKLKVKIPIGGKDKMLPGPALFLYENGTIEQSKKPKGSVVGAEASVDQTAKSSKTWSAGTGLLGNKTIAGHVFLAITGPDINIVQELHEMCAADARRFAGEVNRLAAQLAPDEPKVEVAATESIPDQIAKLSALKDQEILTEDEFYAKKAELLERL